MPFSLFHRSSSVTAESSSALPGAVIDFHTHILPGADHGSDSTDTSLWQLSQASEQGITHIVATPHFYPHRHHVKDFLARRAQALERLARRQNELPSPGPAIYLGSEVLLCPGLQHLDGLEKLCLQHTHVLLLELPFAPLFDEHYDTIEALANDSNLQIVLAHIDRYPPEVIRRVASLGNIQMQLNVEGICSSAYKNCSPWLSTDRVVALGSDMHNRQKNYQLWQKARKKLGARFAPLMQRSEDILSQAGAPALSGADNGKESYHP